MKLVDSNQDGNLDYIVITVCREMLSITSADYAHAAGDGEKQDVTAASSGWRQGAHRTIEVHFFCRVVASAFLHDAPVSVLSLIVLLVAFRH